LNADQVAAMKVYYHGSKNPTLPGLARITPGYTRGSETSNPAALGLAFNESGTEPSFDSLFKWVFGANWQWQTFDYNNNMATVDQVLATPLNANSSDLRPFAGRGGKMIMYHGFADPLLPSLYSINYFNALVQTTQGALTRENVEATKQFARLFMAPGMWHCTGGPGPNSFGGSIQQQAPSYDPKYDLLSALVQWVEQNRAPQSVIATKYTGDLRQNAVAMQRPLCAYPKYAKYNGSGDPSLPTSFTCAAGDLNVQNLEVFNQMPAPQYGP
jgi:feruloyl esterase